MHPEKKEQLPKFVRKLMTYFFLSRQISNRLPPDGFITVQKSLLPR